jgi:hypothetical protein
MPADLDWTCFVATLIAVRTIGYTGPVPAERGARPRPPSDVSLCLIGEELALEARHFVTFGARPGMLIEGAPASSLMRVAAESQGDRTSSPAKRPSLESESLMPKSGIDVSGLIVGRLTQRIVHY